MTWKVAGIALIVFAITTVFMNGNDSQVFVPFAMGLCCLAFHSILKAIGQGS